MTFTHLHLHTQYSLLDGAIKVSDLAKYTKEYGMTSVAITDHGNMYGAVDAYRKCRDAGVKPIIGCEIYVAGKDRLDRQDRQAYHLILLSRTLEGYRNLVYLVSMAHLEGFYYHPRIDRKLLKQYSAGLIGLSACLGGEIPQAILQNNPEKARLLALEYKAAFEPGCFYLELQDNGLAEQEKVNAALIEMSKELDLPLVATNDCHYLRKEDAKAHEILMCIQTGKTLEDEKRVKHETDAYYLKRPEEMVRAFAHVPEAIANTQRIAEMCNVEIPLGKVFLPTFQVPEGHDLPSYLRDRARAGLAARFAQLDAQGKTCDEALYRERLETELDVIVKMDFPGYFLIVWDFIAKAKELGVPVGPGRGSGAGSLVAYALGITDINPIPYDLLFERFLNPERVSMPDFDIDFCMNRRGEVIKYVTEKYGADHVGQIVTFGQLKARSTVRDVARVLGMSYGDGDRVAKLVPEILGITLRQAIDQEPKLKALYDDEPRMKQLLDIAVALEGLNRQTGMHAAGIVIGDKPLWHYVPLCKGQNDELVTQFAKEEVELAGLVKFDFLGLRTLTVIDDAVRHIRKRHADFDLQQIPMDDKKVFDLLSSGNTTGVFQLESSGFKDLMKKLRPDRFEDIIAAVALYRPGPLEGGMVDDFVKRKHGEVEVVYPHPLLAQTLAETYGVIVYQEQVMKIANILAGYSLGDADLLRRAMGKKKASEMAKQRARFLDGAEKRGVDPQLAGDIFDLVEKFAGYGFNKSHSAAYALISYQTAYLKAHYPVEFMAALLTSEKERTEKVVAYIAESRSMGIGIEPPDVNQSEEDFAVVRGAIRFGMGAVKGVGSQAVQAVLEARTDAGEFKSLGDFCERIDSRRVNRKVIESLVKCGAFDFTKAPRYLLFASIERAMERGAKAQRDRASGQLNMLDLFGGGPKKGSTPTAAELVRDDEVPEDERWNEQQRLAFEKECLGFYITGHPLDRFQKELGRYVNTTTARIESLPNRAEVSMAGVVAALRERPLKSGKGRMAFITLEDRDGQVEIVCFASMYMDAEDIIKSDVPLLVRGSVQLEGDGESKTRRVRAEEVVRLSDVRLERTRRIDVALDADVLLREDALAKLQSILARHQGACDVRFLVRVPDVGLAVVALGDGWKVAATDQLLFDMESVIGRDRVVFS